MLSANLELKQQMATKQNREVNILGGFWIICRPSLLMICETDCGIKFEIYGKYHTCTIYQSGFVCSGKFVSSFIEGASSSLDEKNLFFFFFFSLHPFSSSSVGYWSHNPQFVLHSHFYGSDMIPQMVIYKHLRWACGKKWIMRKIFLRNVSST